MGVFAGLIRVDQLHPRDPWSILFVLEKLLIRYNLSYC